MRTRKSRGKKPAVVTLTEAEIMQACAQFAERKGFKLAPMSYLKVFRGKRSKVEVVLELIGDNHEG
jgi:hypothetical protein